MLAVKKNIVLFVSLVLVFLFSCEEKKGNNAIFTKQIITENKSCEWLRDAKNYKNSKNYFPVFYKYYNKKIANKEYDAATRALEIVAIKCIFFYDFKDQFLKTIVDFNAIYRPKSLPLKTTFVDSYLANYHYDKGDLKRSIEYFKNITVFEPNDYKSCYNTARAFYELSYVYFIMGKQDLSLKANFKALQYYTKNNDSEGLGSVYSNYANIYKAIGNKKKAITNIDKAIKVFKTTNNNYDIYMGLYNKICIYDYMSDQKKIMLIDSTYQAFIDSNYKNDVLKIALSGYKVQNLIDQNKLKQAKIILDALKPIIKNINTENWTQDYDATVAKYEIKNNPKNSNIEIVKKAVPFLINNEQYEKVELFYSVLKTHAIQNNDFKNALNYEEDRQIIRDSIADIATRAKVAELETIYETEKKQQQIVLQKSTIVNKNTTIAFLASLFTALFLIVVVYITRQKQKKLKLEKENVQQYTKQLLEKTEEERKRIASDLHDSVSHELLSLKNSFEEKNDITNTKIDAIINDIRIISRNLHPILFDKIGLKASVEQLVERAQSVNDFMVTAEINYIQFLSTSDELQVYRIIQEALSNIIKYSNAIAAKITISDKNDSVFIEIKDNGKGFNVSETLNSRNAFGLHNIIERSRAIGGEAKINSDSKGTIIFIEIKKIV